MAQSTEKVQFLYKNKLSITRKEERLLTSYYQIK